MSFLLKPFWPSVSIQHFRNSDSFFHQASSLQQTQLDLRGHTILTPFGSNKSSNQSPQSRCPYACGPYKYSPQSTLLLHHPPLGVSGPSWICPPVSYPLPYFRIQGFVPPIAKSWITFQQRESPGDSKKQKTKVRNECWV